MAYHPQPPQPDHRPLPKCQISTQDKVLKDSHLNPSFVYIFTLLLLHNAKVNNTDHCPLLYPPGSYHHPFSPTLPLFFHSSPISLVLMCEGTIGNTYFSEAGLLW